MSTLKPSRRPLLLRIIAILLLTIVLTAFFSAGKVNLPTVGFFLVVAVVATHLLIGLVTLAYFSLSGLFAPRVVTRAVVRRKYSREYYSSELVDDTDFTLLETLLKLIMGNFSSWDFRAVFELENAQEVQLNVSDRTYIKLSEETPGILAYRGEKFISFRPTPPIKQKPGTRGLLRPR